MSPVSKPGIKVVAVLHDLIFETKIRSTVAAFEGTTGVARSADEFRKIVEESAPSIVVVDLNHLASKPEDLAELVRAVPADSKVVAYCSHVDHALMKWAKEAGIGLVMPRSRFSLDWAAILEGVTRSMAEQQR